MLFPGLRSTFCYVIPCQQRQKQSVRVEAVRLDNFIANVTLTEFGCMFGSFVARCPQQCGPKILAVPRVTSVAVCHISVSLRLGCSGAFRSLKLVSVFMIFQQLKRIFDIQSRSFGCASSDHFYL